MVSYLGINLSGGQKQRINIARLVYFDPDIVLLDDPLSAVDSHVGRYLFEECLQNALKKKTRILVTHQLHFLPQVDYIFVMNEGQVAEQGTFEELMNSKGAFSALMSEYGGVNEVKDEVIEDKVKQMDAADAKRIGNMLQVKAGGDARELMQKEDRATGSVKANIWLTYMNSAGGWFFGIGLFTLIAMLQACNFGNSLWLVVWTNQEISSWEQVSFVNSRSNTLRYTLHLVWQTHYSHTPTVLGWRLLVLELQNYFTKMRWIELCWRQYLSLTLLH